MIKHLIMTNNATRSSDDTEKQRARCQLLAEHSSGSGQAEACQIKGIATERHYCKLRLCSTERSNVEPGYHHINHSSSTAYRYPTQERRSSTYDKSINTMHTTRAANRYSTYERQAGAHTRGASRCTTTER